MARHLPMHAITMFSPRFPLYCLFLDLPVSKYSMFKKIICLSLYKCFIIDINNLMTIDNLLSSPLRSPFTAKYCPAFNFCSALYCLMNVELHVRSETLALFFLITVNLMNLQTLLCKLLDRTSASSTAYQLETAPIRDVVLAMVKYLSNETYRITTYKKSISFTTMNIV